MSNHLKVAFFVRTTSFVEDFGHGQFDKERDHSYCMCKSSGRTGGPFVNAL
jgi:hypothetical protein